MTAAEKKRNRGVVQKPRPRKKWNGKGGGKGAGTPQPKWINGWKEEKGADAPEWSKRSYASVVSGAKKEEEGDDAEMKEDDSRRPRRNRRTTPLRQPHRSASLEGTMQALAAAPAAPPVRQSRHHRFQAAWKPSWRLCSPSSSRLLQNTDRPRQRPSAATQRQESEDRPPPERQTPPPRPGHRSGQEGLKPGDEGFRCPITSTAEVTLGEATAATKAGEAGAAQAQKEDRARLLAERREAAVTGATGTA